MIKINVNERGEPFRGSPLFFIFVPMKWLVLFTVCLLVACSPSQMGVIEGTLPDLSYDGEQLYLVPLQGATSENVDSVQIENGLFRFEKVVDEPQIFILRLRPLLRLKVQELLVVVEPGATAIATLGAPSSGGGTALNDSLQQWKENKAQNSTYNYNFVRNNEENVVGRFVYSVIKGTLTPEQIELLSMPE